MQKVVVQTGHARNRSAARTRIQLSFAGTAGTQGSSAATDSRHGRSDSEAAFEALRRNVCPRRPTFDTARTVASRAAVADALFSTQRAAAGRGDRLQHSVSLVRGFEPGRCGV